MAPLPGQSAFRLWQSSNLPHFTHWQPYKKSEKYLNLNITDLDKRFRVETLWPGSFAWHRRMTVRTIAVADDESDKSSIYTI